MRRNWKTGLGGLLMTLFLIMGFQPKADAHCEIPCGIYGDEMRIDMLYEHIKTMEKSMNQITELSAEGDKNYNQLVRWVMNKEDHAKKFQDIVTQYFQHQRIKIKEPSNEEEYNRYLKQLEYSHKLLVYAMKAKQTTDLKYIEKLRETLGKFEKAYFGPDAHRHDEEGKHMQD
ncbi:MAG: superoxide dismutase, Ni [Bacteroidales bacterium]|nr:superoxide dismutase, Ni [Bacteroidales bacterium]